MFDCSPPPETSEPMPLPCSVRDLWETEIVPRLPAKLDEQAHALKAYQRYREIERASDLLRALLAWVMGGCSFRQLGCWAVLLGVADISEAAWRKRVRRCGDWLQWLLMELLGSRRELSQQEKKSSQPRMILVDGTSLGQTGGNGDDWRVQLAYDLVEGRLIHVQIGDRHQAETLVGLPGQLGDVFVGDRGYGQRDNVVAMHTLQAEVILRFSPNHCRIEQEDGTRLEISQWLAGLEEDVHISEQEGYCVEEAERVKVRVLALRLPAQAAEEARERVRARAKRKQQVVRPETLQLAGWILLLSTLEAEHWPAEEVFWLYRNRWQIELLIKQMKQFLLLVRLRSHHPETVRATLLAALIAWALQEEEGQALLRTLEHARAGEPGASLSATAGRVGGPGACRSDGRRTSASDQLLAVDGQLYQPLAHRGARTVEFCSGAGVSVAFTALFLFQSQATATPASVVPSVGSAALSGNFWTGGIPLRRLLKFAPMGPRPFLKSVFGSAGGDELPKTHLQHVLTAVAINLVRIDAVLTGTPRGKTRASAFARLRSPAHLPETLGV